MRRFDALAVLLIGAGLAAGSGAAPQAAALPAPAVPSASAAAASLQVRLNFQQTRTLAAQDLSIQFVGYQDSRCPAGVQCIWQGEARAFFWVSGAGLAPQVLTLAWTGGEPDWGQATQIGGYRALLLALEPQPRADGKAKPTDHRATLALQPSTR